MDTVQNMVGELYMLLSKHLAVPIGASIVKVGILTTKDGPLLTRVTHQAILKTWGAIVDELATIEKELFGNNGKTKTDVLAGQDQGV